MWPRLYCHAWWLHAAERLVMIKQTRVSFFVLLLLVLSSSFPIARASRKQSQSSQKVFVDWGGVGHELAIDTLNGRLRIRKPKVLYSPTRYRLDGFEFSLDQKVIEANYRDREVKDKLNIKKGELFYDGVSVTLPAGVQMRNVWQAILWDGWVICLGRTSRTDRQAELRPPFFATELMTFRAKERIARVRYLVFDPPSGIRLYILNSTRRISK